MTVQEEKSYKELEILLERYPVLKAVQEEVWKAFLCMRDSYERGGSYFSVVTEEALQIVIILSGS